MKVSLKELARTLPKPATAEWPDGQFLAEAFAHGTMTLEVFAPRGEDRQAPHRQDRLFLVVSGRSTTLVGDDAGEAAAGDALLVQAGEAFRFAEMSDDFVSWVVSWGPEGGEAEAPSPSVFAAIDA
ncbi:cupin domain-containing protein [Jiella avicenniae]|uniref:Cupin domain-containing protein n=1 Tax=Jiella avicenniae TaxID=2907202 RepID=A0A9X1P355_9HYPH|nr:cupin domain-containing protein [Jiella avicenniae]MCE7030517.1 cupin domain-containing protein [Jiella avicenniae]